MTPKFTREGMERAWSDPTNWKYGQIYFSKEDPRIWVPKRGKWSGWTINFAHSRSMAALMLTILLVAFPLTILAANGVVGTWIWWTTLGGIMAMTGVVCRHYSSPDRYL